MTVRQSSVLGTDRRISTVEDYVRSGGGRPLALAQRAGPETVIDEIKASGLRGRGGAGFPTGRKWMTVRDDPCPTRYVVCNAAEGEPGTFKDRWLLRQNPYQVLEGVAIAAVAVGAERAFIAIKEIYDTEIGLLQRALQEMREADLLASVLIEIVTGPDDYLFGEEKAMLEVIEGNDALPRIFPPYQVGLFAKSGSANPTVVNNVETFANVPAILRAGAAWYRSFGTEESPGTMVFTVVGDVRVPGMYELPLGIPFKELIYDVAGGPHEGREIKVVFPGAAHGVLTPDRFDTPADFDSLKEVGSGLGSGGFVVYDDSTCIVEALLAFSRFLHAESCGQCAPCKAGTQDFSEILERIERGDAADGHLEVLASRCGSVTGGQLCYLPTGASLLVKSVLDAFEDELRGHLGAKCSRRRGLPIPKLVDFDDRSGRFTFDDTYETHQAGIADEVRESNDDEGGSGPEDRSGDEKTEARAFP